MTETPTSPVPAEHQSFLGIAYGLSEETVVEGLLDTFANRDLGNPDPSEALVDALADGLRDTYFEQSGVPAVPEALESAFLPVALKVVNLIGEDDYDYKPRGIARATYEILLEQTYRNLCNGADAHAAIVYNGDEEEIVRTTESYPLDYLSEDHQQPSDSDNSPSSPR